ncbi:conserved hypothetical protein [Pyrobaculum islandicum DSM 4184]|uniref:Uncharacterized protein n=1 Tax=Pyrobaculum islandicum (strain DSM 4184 / JCM 9189 / GEO3) TaxID=384616 RepID=A1RSW6_PYRIL|nr:hypothetical protein [Pyrobaculum islandicum]ABL88048.1 conserved hypothetical protein [Pyrobaculum islandicum DSM 4184]
MQARGLTTVESLLIAAAFIIVGVIGVLTFQGIGKSAAESLRANAIVTADRGGFDVTVEVLNGKVSAVYVRYGPSGGQLSAPIVGSCIVAQNSQIQTNVPSTNLLLVAGQSATCRFTATLQSGVQYTYVVYAIDANSGKSIQIAKGVVTVGIS